MLNFLSKHADIPQFKVNFVANQFVIAWFLIILPEFMQSRELWLLHDTNCDSEIEKLVIQICLVLPHTDFTESPLVIMFAASTKDVEAETLIP